MLRCPRRPCVAGGSHRGKQGERLDSPVSNEQRRPGLTENASTRVRSPHPFSGPAGRRRRKGAGRGLSWSSAARSGGASPPWDTPAACAALLTFCHSSACAENGAQRLRARSAALGCRIAIAGGPKRALTNPWPRPISQEAARCAAEMLSSCDPTLLAALQARAERQMRVALLVREKMPTERVARGI